ncbi:alcohol dehydrogenase catalytic domain-containing protein [Actinoplanes xinjiangensis]|jgi:S-(hydroxymethyl)glutathione dehydrogenase/alcohol dehydrogenase|uniref:S-(Hydroxymethyl)glutathione dehydrogenase/alcohol dehydrogenase n=1 Tax=Actinoplanes xinjiangensis TaxID=512350 RepID=A0A316FR99_9ACTN|nr:alcohol dehydrogenase catalytic domain-containing protein [Actinoplanes xinjiangensis]PWK50692.1 S-(hydroxymethyl)glutathione dehydrogenase/alcohol dehydrogenase [Actinoplanes xinjiangensis]GIF36582.1 alcohol dehydrogenase [Actinoplanes xinjiangensis]
MTQYMTGLVVRDTGAPAALAELRLPEIGPGQVRVRVRAAGVCHSDLSMVNGTLRPPHPLILGHEAAGEVVEIGEHVTRTAVGDHVVLNWQPACRTCWFCEHGEPWLCSTSHGVAAQSNGITLDGAPVHVTLGVGAFAEQVVVPENAVIPVPQELAFDLAALLGCAVLTGTGAVRNTARVAPGESVVVIGLGGVGLSVVAAARAAGAAQVIAVDVTEAKKGLAEAAGATDFVVSSDNLSKDIRGRTGRLGADHAIECVGRAATIRAAWRATRSGGQVTVVGMGAADDMVQLSALDIFSSARTLRASVYGQADTDLEVPALARDVLDGTLNLDHLITDRITLAEVPAAFDRMSRGEGARSVALL